MARTEYIKVRQRSSSYFGDVDASNYLARTVHEDYELIDTGVIGPDGEKIMARRRMDPIGYVRFPDASHTER